MNNSRAIGAVGHANSFNRVSIILFCHRVITPNNKLVGCSGLERKRWYNVHKKVIYINNISNMIFAD